MPFAATRQVAPGDPRELDHQIALFRAEIANLAAHMQIDGQARLQYDTRIRQMAEELTQRARRGEITWNDAAAEASTLRNTTLDLIRRRSTPVGKAFAQSIKPSGIDINTMIARKTMQLFGEGAQFGKLTAQQQNEVYAAIVKSAGKSNAVITSRMRIISRAGRGLLVLSVGIAVYDVATSKTPGKTAVREGSGLAAGIAGGMAGGALAGLACGPGAPVCVTVGAFVGGALAAFGVDYYFF